MPPVFSFKTNAPFHLKERGVSRCASGRSFKRNGDPVFAYGQKNVYEVKEKLYQLEEQLVSFTFMRASKSMILNLDKIRHLSPAFGGRFEALLENKEKVIISRQYVPVLKERLGL